jgi:cytochrome P450
MTSGVAGSPYFPMTRAPGCPFDPSPDLRELQNTAELTKVRLWNGSLTWLVMGYDAGRRVLLEPNLSSNPTTPGFPHMTNMTSASSEGEANTGLSFVHKDNPDHDVERRILAKYFAIRRIESLRPMVQKLVDGLIDDMLQVGPPADFVEAFALPLPSLAICELLGVPYAERDIFQRCSKITASRNATSEEMTRARVELKDYLTTLAASKARNPGNDILSQLGAEQSLTSEQLADVSLLLLFAGHETTANMIALGTLLLLENPGILDELRSSDDPVLLTNAIEELLRYLNITHMGRRRVATGDIELCGEVIKAGEGVIVTGDTANRDPRAFPDPDRLDIHRYARHHVTFGYGIHQCLGQPLARLELHVVFGTLFRRIPTLRRAQALRDIPFKSDSIVYGAHSALVTW